MEIAICGFGPHPWSLIHAQKWFTIADEVLGPGVDGVPSFTKGIASENRKKHVHQQRNKTNKIAEYLRNESKNVKYLNHLSVER